MAKKKKDERKWMLFGVWYVKPDMDEAVMKTAIARDGEEVWNRIYERSDVPALSKMMEVKLLCNIAVDVR